MSTHFPAALSTAQTLAAPLRDPRTAWHGTVRPGGRAWPQSLAGGAAGIALLHIELARSGHADWVPAHTWIAAAVQGEITAAANASLFFGTPALAFVVHLAAEATNQYRRALARLDEATLTITRTRIAHARARIAKGERPGLREFDLIRGLAGLGAYHVSAHPSAPITRDILACLISLTRPIPDGGELPPWWTPVAPSGEPSPDFPQGHGNLGVSHGISSVLAVLSLAHLRGITIHGMPDAITRICAWTDQWRQDGCNGPWWPGFITADQAREHHVDPMLRPRPSWCYGIAGTARAQQLAGIALREPARQEAAEAAMLAVLRDPTELDRLQDPGLCHGTAGLLNAASRIAGDARTTDIREELPGLCSRLMTQLALRTDPSPELLDGTAGIALALHAVSAGGGTGPSWDAVFAVA